MINYQEELEYHFNVRVAMRLLYGQDPLPDGTYAKYFNVTISHKGEKRAETDYWYLSTGACGHPDAALRQAYELLLGES